LSLNPSLNCNFLPVGQQICVPSIDTTPVNPVIPVNPNCNYLYTLFAGDSCDGIALAYKTTVITLITLNPTLNCQNLPIGQKICVPFVDSPNIPITPACTNYYTIFGTDTCQSIALAYATTTDVLLSLNPSLNCNHLPFGTTICVPQISNPLPTPSPVQPIQSCSNFYTTFYGDTCDKLV
jgi:peptidoglycan DL-endopeptidase LytF